MTRLRCRVNTGLKMAALVLEEKDALSEAWGMVRT